MLDDDHFIEILLGILVDCYDSSDSTDNLTGTGIWTKATNQRWVYREYLNRKLFINVDKFIKLWTDTTRWPRLFNLFISLMQSLFYQSYFVRIIWNFRMTSSDSGIDL